MITTALWALVKGMGVQMVLSSILLEKGKCVRRRALIMQINNWLWNWSWQQGFGSYNHGSLFAEQHLLRTDGIHLIKCGKVTFASRTADLVRRNDGGERQ